MAIRGVNLNEKEPFILPEDEGHPEHPAHIAAVAAGRKPEQPTIYYIGNLTAGSRVELGDMTATPTMRDGGIMMSMRNVQKAHEVVRRGLKGWDNQLDADGKPVEFKAATVATGSGSFEACVADECMMHLSQEVIADLSLKIQEKNGLVASVEKKSDPALPPSDENLSVIGDAETATTLKEPNADA